MTDPQEPQVRPDAAVDDSAAELEAGAPVAATSEPEPEPESEPVATITGGATTTSAADDAGEPNAAEGSADEPVTRKRGGRKAARPEPKPLAPYAIVETGGKQYRVSVGDSLAVERLAVEAGTDVTFDRVLLLGGDGATRVGTPTVGGASVTARVEDQFRGEKIIVFKYKAKKRYRRRIGHRQSLTRLTITGITA